MKRTVNSGMEVYRIEVVNPEDETDRTGIFHVLNQLDNIIADRWDEEDYEWACRRLEEFLPIPDIEQGLRTLSFFTEAGLEQFKEEIDVLKEMAEKYLSDAGLGDVAVIKSNLNVSHPYYSDEYQVLMLEKDVLFREGVYQNVTEPVQEKKSSAWMKTER